MSHSVEIVDLVRDDQWELPTPCAQWNLRQLLAHMISENRGFAAAADGETSDRSAWDDPHLGDGDIRDAYARSADQVVAAFGADGVLDREFWLPRLNDSVRFPARQAISFHLLDYVVHGWDVAVAIGHRVAFDDDLLDAALDITDREVPDGPRRHRPGASFGPPVGTSGAGSKQDRLLAALGRAPSWPN